MNPLLLTALLFTQVTTAPTNAAMLFVGQSTCLGYDSQGSKNNTADTLGNKRPRSEIFTRLYGGHWGGTALFPYEPFSDETNCGLGRGVDTSKCDVNDGYNGPRRGAATHWQRRTGQTLTPFLSAGAGVPVLSFIDAGAFRAPTRAALEAWGSRAPNKPIYIVTCQGEADATGTYANYLSRVQTWQAQLEADAQAATSYWRGRPVPVYAMQYASCSAISAGFLDMASCTSMQALVDAAKGPARGKIIITGPAYNLVHNSVHPTGTGACGYSGNEIRAAAADEAIIYHQTTGQIPTLWWEAVERLSSTQFRITYNVRTQPLQFDTSQQVSGQAATAISDPTFFGGSKGFHIRRDYGDFGFPAISAVDICTGSGAPTANCQNTSQIVITHASESGAVWLKYAAMTDASLNNPGTQTGMRGVLRDGTSATYTPDRACDPQPVRNWAIAEHKLFAAL